MTYEDTYRDPEKYFFAKAFLGLMDNDASYVRASYERALDFVKEYEYRRDHKRGPKKPYIHKGGNTYDKAAIY